MTSDVALLCRAVFTRSLHCARFTRTRRFYSPKSTSNRRTGGFTFTRNRRYRASSQHPIWDPIRWPLFRCAPRSAAVPVQLFSENWENRSRTSVVQFVGANCGIPSAFDQQPANCWVNQCWKRRRYRSRRHEPCWSIQVWTNTAPTTCFWTTFSRLSPLSMTITSNVAHSRHSSHWKRLVDR